MEACKLADTECSTWQDTDRSGHTLRHLAACVGTRGWARNSSREKAVTTLGQSWKLWEITKVLGGERRRRANWWEFDHSLIRFTESDRQSKRSIDAWRLLKLIILCRTMGPRRGSCPCNLFKSDRKTMRGTKKPTESTMLERKLVQLQRGVRILWKANHLLSR